MPPEFGRLRRGYNPHNTLLASALPSGIDAALEDMEVKSDEAVSLVVTGDVSRSGTEAEFRIARAYLHGERRTNTLERWGIESNGKPLEIPGNHDHWDGVMFAGSSFTAFQRAFNPAILAIDPNESAYFESHPWPRTLEGVDLAIEFYGIDTQSGFGPSESNLLARGAISGGHLTDLDRLLGETGTREDKVIVRALMAHHPLEADAFGAGMLDTTSMRSLERRLLDHRFDAVLVGHQHRFRARRIHLPDGAITRPILEICAPSALQASSEDGVHGFVAHEVRYDSDSQILTWAWHPWLWDATNKAFRPDEPDSTAL